MKSEIACKNKGKNIAWTNLQNQHLNLADLLYIYINYFRAVSTVAQV